MRLLLNVLSCAAVATIGIASSPAWAQSSAKPLVIGSTTLHTLKVPVKAIPGRREVEVPVQVKLRNPSTAVVSVTVEQLESQGYPDQFALKVNKMNASGFTVWVGRADANNTWGVNLQLHVVVFD